MICSIITTIILKIMIEIMIIALLMVIIVALVVLCIFLKEDIEDMTITLRRINELYRQECDKNIDKIAKEIFRDDMESLNR